MNLTALPAFSDNYIWMLDDGRTACVVDPGESAPVERELDARGLTLGAILVTHHHADHTGGVDALRPRLRGPVYGPARELIPVPFTALAEDDEIEVPGWRFRVIDIPGHTAGHIAFFGTALPLHDAAGPQAPLLFCGDTLFSAGCGRLFEGTPAQMHASLAKLAALPGDTRVCCGHEYTLANLAFARVAEPGNETLAGYTAWCQAERAAFRPTLPSCIARERAVNPFLRCGEPSIVQRARERGAAASDPVSVLAALRSWKNGFR
jgi:hydroxyacylglutathione hydrolase